MTERKDYFAEVTQVFDSAIYAIRDANIPRVSEIAERSVQKFRNKELFIVTNTQLLNIPTVTGFEMYELPQTAGMPEQYVPIISLDADKMMGMDKRKIQGDLVRTLAIADQFPTKGYERRYKEVYKDALETQRIYLEETNTPPLPFDPRTEPVDTILKKILGDARYYGDVGFADWQKAIIEYKQSEQDLDVTELLDLLYPAKEHFLVMRANFVEMNYQIGSLTDATAFYEMNDDKRAEAAAYALMGSSLYARDMSSFN